MHHIIYLSSANYPFATEELDELLARSRRKNAEVEVTGMLIYSGGNFLQVIEGGKESVDEIFEAICRDPRHHGIMVLFDEEIPERDFGDWSMAFRSLEGSAQQGFNDLLNDSASRSKLDEYPLKLRAFMQSFLKVTRASSDDASFGDV